MCIRRHIKYLLFLSDFNRNWIFSTEFLEIHRHDVDVNLPSESRVVQWGQASEKARRREGEQAGEQAGRRAGACALQAG